MNSCCPICSSNVHEEIQYPGNDNALEFKFISVCKECGHGHVVTNKNDGDLEKFYSSGQYWDTLTKNKVLILHNSFQAEYRVRKVRETSTFDDMKTIKVLDVGAGQGYICDWLCHYFPQKEIIYYFTEPDDRSSESILKRNNHAIKKRIQSLDSLNGEIDVIFLNHVIEHVLSVKDFLEHVIICGKRKCLFYIEVPHCDYRFKSDVFPHVHFFTIQSFSKILGSIGLKNIQIVDFGYLSMNRRKLITKLRNVFYSQFLSFLAKTNFQKSSHFLWKKNFKIDSKQANTMWLSGLASKD